MNTSLRKALVLFLCFALSICWAPTVFAAGSTAAASVIIPKNTIEIEEEAFYNCINMVSVSIPSTVLRIGDRAFYGCRGLKDIYYSGTEEQWDAIMLGTGNGPLTRATIHCTASIPGESITMIVAYKGGSATDNATRLLARYAEKYIGKTIVIENDEGASGAIGWSVLANAAPDGKTIGIINLPNFSNSIVNEIGTYTVESFKPICNHVTETSVVVVRADDDRFSNLKALADYGKENEDNGNILKASTNGPHAFNHVGAQLFANSADFMYIDISRASTADQLLSLLSGEADFSVVKLNDIAGQESAYRILGVFNSERLPELPEIPTLGEQGYYSDWWGSSQCIVAPAGVSENIIEFYESAFKAAMEDPYYITAVKESGISTDYKDSEETEALINQQQIVAESVTESFWNNNTWKLRNTGELVIFDTKAMKNYSSGAAPWYNNRASITSVTLKAGINIISSNSFYGCSNISSVTIPSSIMKIDNDAFYGCNGLKDVYYDGTEEQWDAIMLGTGNGPLTRAAIHCGDNSDDFFINLTYSNVFNPAEWNYKAAELFAEAVTERTEGHITVTYHGINELDCYRDSIVHAENGDNWIGLEEPSLFADWVGDCEVLVGPMLYNNDEEYNYVMDSDLVADVIARLAEENIHILDTHYSFGYRSVVTNKDIYTPADLNGVKLRSTTAPLFIKTIECLGATPIPMSFSECLYSISRGVVDGFEGSTFTLAGAGAPYELVKKVARTNHFIATRWLFMAQNVYESIPEKWRDILDECALEFGMWEQASSASDEQTMIDKLETEDGVTWNEVDIDAFTEVCAPVYDWIVEEYGASPNLYPQLLNALNAFRTGNGT